MKLSLHHLHGIAIGAAHDDHSRGLLTRHAVALKVIETIGIRLSIFHFTDAVNDLALGDRHLVGVAHKVLRGILLVVVVDHGSDDEILCLVVAALAELALVGISSVFLPLDDIAKRLVDGAAGVLVGPTCLVRAL